MEMFYTKVLNENQSEAEFDSFESQHILKAMRKSEADYIHFTDGHGKLFKGWISETKPTLKVQCNLVKELVWPPPVLSILGIGFIRHARLDYLIEKATELGVNKFYFFKSRYTNYYTENVSRWEKITRQAIKQSNRLYLPEIKFSDNFSDFLDTVSDIKYKYLADQSGLISQVEIYESLEKASDKDIIFIIGPEGGFDEQEIKLAKDHKFVPVSFGENRLRTETASISAASYINLIRY